MNGPAGWRGPSVTRWELPGSSRPRSSLPRAVSGSIYVVVYNGHGDATGLLRQEPDGALTLAASVTYDTWGRLTVNAERGSPTRSVPESRARHRSA